MERENEGSAAHAFDETTTFAQHVADSCLKPFPPTYFATGLCEETMELLEQLWAGNDELAIKEVGDCLWYTFALARSIQLDVSLYQQTAINSEHGSTEVAQRRLMLALGSLSGSVKKLSRGDGGLQQFQTRIGTDLNRYLSCLATVAPCSLPTAATENITKLRARRLAGTVQGDGNLR